MHHNHTCPQGFFFASTEYRAINYASHHPVPSLEICRFFENRRGFHPLQRTHNAALQLSLFQCIWCLGAGTCGSLQVVGLPRNAQTHHNRKSLLTLLQKGAQNTTSRIGQPPLFRARAFYAGDCRYPRSFIIEINYPIRHSTNHIARGCCMVQLPKCCTLD